MIRSLVLALLGGVRISDALEAVCYERQRPAGNRSDRLSPGAEVIWRKADELDRSARGSLPRKGDECVLHFQSRHADSGW